MLHELNRGNILMACGFIGGVNRELPLINVNFSGLIGDKIGLANELIIESKIFVDGSVMHMPNLKAQLRTGKEAESQFFVYLIPFLERDGADRFIYTLVQCSVLGVTQELPG